MKAKYEGERKEDVLDRLHKNNVLCAKHFEPSMFTKSKKRLIRTALPTLFDIPNCPKPQTAKRPPPKDRPREQPKPKRKRIDKNNGKKENMKGKEQR